jgi:hypothetical protein
MPHIATQKYALEYPSPKINFIRYASAGMIHPYLQQRCKKERVF